MAIGCCSKLFGWQYPNLDVRINGLVLDLTAGCPKTLLIFETQHNWGRIQSKFSSVGFDGRNTTKSIKYNSKDTKRSGYRGAARSKSRCKLIQEYFLNNPVPAVLNLLIEYIMLFRDQFLQMEGVKIVSFIPRKCRLKP